MALRLRLSQPRWTIRVNRGAPGPSEALLELLGWAESALDAATLSGAEGLFESLVVGEGATALIRTQSFASEPIAVGEAAAAAMALALFQGGEGMPVAEAATDRVTSGFAAADPVPLLEVSVDQFRTLGIDVALEPVALGEARAVAMATTFAGVEALAAGEARASTVAYAAQGSAEAIGIVEAATIRHQVTELLGEAVALAESRFEDVSHLDGGPFVETVTDFLSPAGSMFHWTETQAELIPLSGLAPTVDALTEAATVSENRADLLAVRVALAESIAVAESRTDSTGARVGAVENLTEFIPLATGGPATEALVELIPLGS